MGKIANHHSLDLELMVKVTKNLCHTVVSKGLQKFPSNCLLFGKQWGIFLHEQIRKKHTLKGEKSSLKKKICRGGSRPFSSTF
jgi:hypothetical protein